MHHISNLILKPIKCIIVPLACIADDGTIEHIRTWLRQHIPDWKDFSIQSYGKYLGFLIGPEASLLQWKAPLSKWRNRTASIAALAAPASVSCALYNVRALPVLMYKGQLLPMPHKHAAAEKGVIHKLLHIPNNALSLRAAHSLQVIGGPRIGNILDMNNAARFRTATVTIKHWKEHCANILALAMMYIPLHLYEAGRHYAQHWSGPPIAFYMQAAAEGTFNVQASSTHHQPHAADQHTSLKSSTSLELRSLRRAQDKCRKPMKVQSKALKILTQQSMSISGWALMMDRRLRKHLHELHHRDLHYIEWQDVFKLMKLVTIHHAMCLMKTYTGSWCTSRRFHEATSLACLFGCEAEEDDEEIPKDDMAHYLYCPRLLFAVGFHTGLPPLTNPIAQLGLHPPCLARMTMTLVAFQAYHNLKLSKLEDIAAARLDGPSAVRAIVQAAVNLAVRCLKWNTTGAAREAVQRAISANAPT